MAVRSAKYLCITVKHYTIFTIVIQVILCQIVVTNGLPHYLQPNSVDEGLETSKIEKVVSEINAGNIQGAIEFTKDLHLNPISQIIRQSFQNNSDKLKAFENIMSFIKTQSKINKNISYKILYNEMIEYSTLEYLNLERFYLLENMTANLCILEIKLGKIQGAFEHFEHLKLISISQIIHESYDTENFENVINFINKLPKINERNMSYATLMKEMLDAYKLEGLESIKMDLCVLKILHGETDEADKLFKDLTSFSLGEVLNKSYNLHNGLEELKNILSFIESQEGTYCNVLKASKNIIANILKEKITPTNLEIGSKLLLDLFSRDFQNYDKCINETQDLWVNIISNNCGLVTYISLRIFRPDVKENIRTEFTSKYYDDIIGPSIQATLKMDNILRNKFDSVFRCASILSFLDQRSLELLTQTLSMSFDELKKNNFINNQNQITKFAYSVKSFMEKPEYQKLSAEYKNTTEDIKLNLPDWARTIIWKGDKCKLKNRYLGEYLYACGQCNNDSEHRRVFVGSPEIEAESQWTFEIDTKGNFTIRNVHWKEFLFAVTERPDSWIKLVERRPVFTRTDGIKSDCSWKITQSKDENVITIQRNGEHLYVDGSDEWKKLGRRVFTSIPGQTGILAENEWEVMCE